VGMRKLTANFRISDINAAAKANILEGALGLKKDSLSGGKGIGVSPIIRGIEELKRGGKHTLAKIDPEFLDVKSSREGPVTKGMVDALSKRVEKSYHSNYMGIDAMMYVVGLWDSSMMPGADGGFARTNAPPFWYSLGRQFSNKIIAGQWGMRDAINLTGRRLEQMAGNYENLAGRRNNDQVMDIGTETYETGSDPLDPRQIITEFFAALHTPSNSWHNRAKEWWQDKIVSDMGTNVYAVMQAFFALGSTDSLGIKGGYGAAAQWIAENTDLNISPRGIKKAWEKVKLQFRAKFEAGMNDPQYSDLWVGLSDAVGINAEFSRDQGMQIMHDDGGRYASIVNRHTYRQTLTQRATKTRRL